MRTMGDAIEIGLPRAVAIAWGMQEVPQRGPSRGLSHERIVEAGMGIADAEGLGAVTMQSVAKTLGFTTMSLYRYVSSKDELLRLMQDAASALPEKVKLSGDWRQALKTWAELIRDAHRAHPWALEIPRGQISVLMPNSVRAADLGLAAMRELDLTEEEKIGIILVVSQHVAGMVELELNLADEGQVAMTSEGASMLSEVITAERFPDFAPLISNGSFVSRPEPDQGEGNDDGVDLEFDLGLELIFSGLEEKMRSARSG